MNMGTSIPNPQPNHPPINWPILLQNLIKCCSKACKIIHRSSSKPPTIKYKSSQDPVSQIDHTIQKLIMTALSSPQFEGINIIGEEHIDQVMIDYGILEEVCGKEGVEGMEGEGAMEGLEGIWEGVGEVWGGEFGEGGYRDVGIFIDPLDCTRGYICGKLWECTVLIGVTLKGKPVLGIIGQPFKKTSSKEHTYDPRIIVGGTILQQKAYFQLSKNTWQKFHPHQSPQFNPNSTPTIAVSSRRCSQHQQNLISTLRANKIHCGGSGNKLAMVIRGEVDAVCFVECPLSTWDSCAGEAIVLGLGGILTKPNSKRVLYDVGKQDQTIYSGYICCLDLGLHERIIGCLKEEEYYHHQHHQHHQKQQQHQQLHQEH